MNEQKYYSHHSYDQEDDADILCQLLYKDQQYAESYDDKGAGSTDKIPNSLWNWYDARSCLLPKNDIWRKKGYKQQSD